SFRFDSDQTTAGAAQSTLGAFEAGSPMSFQIQTLAPATVVAPPPGFYTLAPCRLLDTRTQQAGPIDAGAVREVAVSGCGIPASATSAAINVTAINSTSSGDVAVYAVDPPTVANSIVSFGLGATRANNAIAPISATGTLKIKPNLSALASMHVVVDVVGYFQ
ncbi:MAG: hypothetical protein ABUL63_00945, partial [Acidobacteriota bacterium]